MKIESILKRPNGTTVDFPGATYHFKAEHPGGPHVADVADEGHAERLLAIREGYRAVGKSKPAAPTPPVETPAPGGSHVLQGTGGAEQADVPTDTGASAEQRNDDDTGSDTGSDTGTGDTPSNETAAAAAAPDAPAAPAKKRGRPSTKAK